MPPKNKLKFDEQQQGIRAFLTPGRLTVSGEPVTEVVSESVPPLESERKGIKSGVGLSGDGDEGQKWVFNSSWLKLFSWFVYKPQNRMFCSKCKQTRKKNSFTSGYMNFRKSSVTDHADTHDHQVALEVTGD